MMKNCKETLLDRGRKLVSLLLCALTATACTDTLDEAALPKPLSVDVNARDITARAPIHGTALPDASSIGISILAEDGTAYDGVTYANIKYTASGTAPDQTWSTPNIPTLSSTPAKLVAYYPWADGTDYTAVPVETDTQTDYMYSGWLTGLSNVSPKANIVMQHALTAVRVALVKGDFTADVDVSSVSVKSPAFATAGSLDATTGVLSGLTGTGEAVTVTADFPLTAQATNVEVMAVPDVSVASGVTTVTTQIGNRKYSVSINFTESYKQGYIYTYTLTLNNTGMEMTSVAVTPWQEGTTNNGKLDIVPDNRYIVDIKVDEAGTNYIHNVIDFTGTIDWGDGTTSTYDEENTEWPTHIYTTAGEYTVVTTGNIGILNSYYFISPFSLNSRFTQIDGKSNLITRIVEIGKGCGIRNIEEGFFGQDKLTVINKGVFDGLQNIQNISATFSGCTALTSIPEGLFDKCTEVISFMGTFSGCTALTSIPEGLFDKCVKVESFGSTFQDCTALTSIPEGLFDNCPKVTDFWDTFGRLAITEIPEGLFDKCTEVTDFSGAFRECSELTSIPAGLFDNNTEVTSFGYVFEKCTGLKNIPAGLFKNCTEVTDFSGAFRECTALTSIPEGLFDKCTEVTDFAYAFKNTAITKIPAGLFDKCTEVTIFNSTFENTAITEIPTGLFDKCTKTTNFNMVFKGTSITTIPEGLFDKCTEAAYFHTAFANTAITEIPVGLFDKCTKVINFYGTFSGCTALTGDSPYTTINVDGNDVKVHLYERSSYPEHFAAPQHLMTCFKSCTGLTDYANIPASWK